MMKRMDKIYAYIKEKSGLYTRESLKGKAGIDAKSIADDLAILRNNVSMELNALYRQGKIIKIMGRPVLYFDKEALEKIAGKKIEGALCPLSTLEEWIGPAENENKGPFDLLIGADGSLKKQVEQAKAAILYPPDGLHTLIVGQTGVGKTLFAHMMYEYGIVMKKLAPTAPFITFNCADYYNNAQLLISHIFGHVKGAFTGADASKAGLVEAADQGILFLDEIHRLPPEGQEMIFYFIDTGTFSRLGETARDRRAKVLLIGATTEDPNSVLTKTFVRRIPNIITIQPLAERSLSEKFAIVKMLLADEVRRINKPVKISNDAVKALIGSIGAGNVGQLKSNIKLLCAKAFLHGIDKEDYIEIDFKMLPTKIKGGLLTLTANRRDLAELGTYMSEALLISPEGKKDSVAGEADEAFNLYRIVEDKITLLKGEGISDALIKQTVATDVNVYIQSFYHKQDRSMSARERLLKILDKPLVDFAEEINLLVQKKLSMAYRERFFYAFSLHLSAFLKRVKSGGAILSNELEGTIEKEAPEFKIALEIKERIEKRYRVEVPQAETEYFALLLDSLREEEPAEKVIIMVATHGRSAASSMVEVAQKLLSGNEMNVVAIDMPLDVDPQVSLDKMICKLNDLNYQKGVLLLVDMGSLRSFGAMIMEQLQVEVRTIDMVSMPLILEAMRKADIVGMELESLYESLLGFKGYEISSLPDAKPGQNGNDVIVTICTSGEGAAIKLKEMVEQILSGMDREIKVEPVGVKGLDEKLEKIALQYHIVAAVGMVKPKRDVPFISLEELIGGAGEHILASLLQAQPKPSGQAGNAVVKNLCGSSLQKFLTYLNPVKVVSVLMDFSSVLEKGLGRTLGQPMKIRLLVHCGCALERMVIKRGLSYQGDASTLDPHALRCLREAADAVEKALQIRLTDDELYYMAEMI